MVIWLLVVLVNKYFLSRCFISEILGTKCVKRILEIIVRILENVKQILENSKWKSEKVRWIIENIEQILETSSEF